MWFLRPSEGLNNAAAACAFVVSVCRESESFSHRALDARSALIHPNNLDDGVHSQANQLSSAASWSRLYFCNNSSRSAACFLGRPRLAFSPCSIDTTVYISKPRVLDPAASKPHQKDPMRQIEHRRLLVVRSGLCRQFASCCYRSLWMACAYNFGPALVILPVSGADVFLALALWVIADSSAFRVHHCCVEFWEKEDGRDDSVRQLPSGLALLPKTEPTSNHNPIQASYCMPLRSRLSQRTLRCLRPNQRLQYSVHRFEINAACSYNNPSQLLIRMHVRDGKEVGGIGTPWLRQEASRCTE
ncbi:hypothetical protein PHSY_000437 [Pseudozyma hubeiensis SY62]|uniref:Uncharacterized protein n=1 Tax=Pseudozyma hubeiensis (strain SY62) TaxID=1305764 RepID=R9NWH8_PSEHS|nr:hypothetical protein PHSY_000437 [Pseudozyma hubeiensis SY62]GAC92879.1 hypothetical protein PHSY_000437 [Pseudozyma hubeiensis SY62]